MMIFISKIQGRRQELLFESKDRFIYQKTDKTSFSYPMKSKLSLKYLNR